MTASKTLKLSQIKEKAKLLGLNPQGLKKTELIRAIQQGENNNPCFGTSTGHCPYTDCCFMADCMALAT